ncbi:MAG: hypothetical protein IKE76_08315, partial [Clostridia bacterium]|nr:hypothetical protein [Clostridia bacterium]
AFPRQPAKATAEAVAAFAVIHWRRPQAPGIFCASQFVRLQKILNTAVVETVDGANPIADFVATHYGDWPAPEIFVFNKPT